MYKRQPDYYFPGSGVLLQRNLGIKEIGALDVRNQCSGFIYGLSIADQYIKSGMYKNILLVGSEIHSGGLDKSTKGRSVSVIFGDGAGAAVISSTNSENGILSTHLHSEGKYAEELAVIKPATTHWIDKIKSDQNDESYWPYMNGNFVFKNAVVRFEQVIKEGLEFSNLNIDELIKFHHASGKLATLTAVKPPGRFGSLVLENDQVSKFTEKPLSKFRDLIIF